MSGFLTDGGEDPVRRKRAFPQSYAYGIIDGIRNRGKSAIDTDFGYALGTIGPGFFPGGDENRLDFRRILRSEDLVIVESRIAHTPFVVELILFRKSVGNPVENGAFHLSFRQLGVDGRAAIHRGYILDHTHLSSLDIDRHLHEMGREGGR